MNVSLDACCEHTQVLADDEYHARISDLFDGAEALLFGRNTFDLLHGYWPNVASTGAGTPSEVRLANILNAKPKYVVSSRDPGGWKASRVDGTAESIRRLKNRTDGMLLLVASPTLARTVLEWNLVDEYHVAVSPMVAGRGPTFLAGLTGDVTASLLGLDRLESGVVILRYAFGAQASSGD